MENNTGDVLKMFEQAMALSKAFGGEEAGQDTFDMQKMAQTLQIYQMFKNFSDQPAEKPVEKAQDEKKTPDDVVSEPRQVKATGFYDEAIHTPELNRIKAAVPFLEPKYRNRVGLFVKLMEMRKLMEMYSVEAAAFTGKGADSDWRRGMLRAIHPHMSANKKPMVELLIKIIDINEIMLKMNSAKA